MLKKLVLTGAAGKLGSYLRGPLAAMCEELVSTDIADAVPDLATNETYIKADLTEQAPFAAMLQAADMHLNHLTATYAFWRFQIYARPLPDTRFGVNR